MGTLSGRTIGVTAQRRAGEFIDALERHDATVWHAPTIETVALPDDETLYAVTRQVLDDGIDALAVTTGAGFRGWLSAAEGWGMAESLRERFDGARIVVRGPKAKGAVRQAGLSEAWSAPGETNAELVEHLLAEAAGPRVAVQLHGAPAPEVTGPLERSGATVLRAQPYRWHWPADLAPARGLLAAVAEGAVDALAFTSAPAAANLLTLAHETDHPEWTVDTLRAGRVRCACVGSVTAAPLTEAGIPTLRPERQRLGALAKLLIAELGAG